MNWMTLWWIARTLSIVAASASAEESQECRHENKNCLMCALLCMRIKHLKCQATATRMFSQMLPLPRWWISALCLTCTKPLAHLHENIYKLSMEVIRREDVKSKGKIHPRFEQKAADIHHQPEMLKELQQRFLHTQLSTCVSASNIDFLCLLFI